MAYKGSFYYDEFDYGNYPETLDYDSLDEHLPSLSDVFNCGVSVSRQIAVQLLCLLSVNFVYRVIRHASELADESSLIAALIKESFRSSRLHKTLVFFFARLLLNLHLLHRGQFFRLSACIRVLRFPEAPGTDRTEKARIHRHCISNSFNFYMVRRCFFLQAEMINFCFCFSELVELESNHWQHVRGSALIISMKAISLAFDISSTKIPKLPPVYEYAGYTLCPANVVLGPFTTFSSYKNCQRNNKLSLRLIMQIVINSLTAIVFIIMSSCLLNYLISDNFKYFVTYRDALIFRCSHYFISFMSSAILLASGIDCKMTSDWMGHQVTKPIDIELPRSLIPVVISWNIPIHLFVKTCKLKIYFGFLTLKNLTHALRCLSQSKAIR